MTTASIFLKCPCCGSDADYKNSDLHDIWGVRCPNSKCKFNKTSVLVDMNWNDVKSSYNELASKWNALVTAYRIEQGDFKK